MLGLNFKPLIAQIDLGVSAAFQAPDIGKTLLDIQRLPDFSNFMPQMDLGVSAAFQVPDIGKTLLDIQRLPDFSNFMPQMDLGTSVVGVAKALTDMTTIPGVAALTAQMDLGTSVIGDVAKALTDMTTIPGVAALTAQMDLGTSAIGDVAKALTGMTTIPGVAALTAQMDLGTSAIGDVAKALTGMTTIPGVDTLTAQMNFAVSNIEGAAKALAGVNALANSAEIFAQAVQLNLGLITGMSDTFQRNIDNIIGSLSLKTDFRGIFDYLPDLGILKESLKDYSAFRDTLSKAGYGFVLDSESPVDNMPIIIINSINIKVRHAAITNRLLALIRQKEFFQTINERFSNSSLFRKRWPIIEQCLVAHKNRSYILSIPTLLSQLEGMFTDILVLKGIVIKDKGKLYARDSNGNLKLNKKNDPIQLQGLGQKIQSSDLQNEPLLKTLAEFIVSSLVPERNNILHGSHLSYDRAKLSLQLILLVYMLVSEFSGLENDLKH